MNSLLLTAIQKGRLWDFRGGIHPPEMKDQTSQIPLKRLPLAEYFILPVQQHIGIESDTLVKIGDRVLKGQPLTSGFDISGKDKALPIHAPTSGIIKDIGYYTTAHPSGLKEKCLYLIADGQDRWIERHPINDYRQCSRNDLIGKIHRSGIAGLGGAGYPTASKLNGGLKKVEALIINAAECEPYITADDRLMQEHAAEIVEGIEILRHILCPTLTIIGIEDNKSQAIEALRQATLDHADILIRVIPTKYPSGGARQLTKILTGREVPQGKHSSAIGVLMQNVSTVYAIKRAVIDDEPLIERVTTLTGEGLETKGNVWVPLGTTVEHLLNFSGCDMSRQHSVAIMGGPLMGFTLPNLAIPIVKISNCILVPSTQEVTFSQQEQNCIRCGQCSDVCPAGLLPQQLYWYSRGKEHDKARNYNLFDCIECGACAYVCPSHIPLVQYYRQEKAEIKQLDKNALLAQQAKKRFEAKQSRLEREKIARQERHKNAAVSIDSEQNEEIQSALARVRAQQQARTSPLNITSVEQHQLQDNSQIKAARQARKDLARQRQSEKLKYGVGIFDPKEELRNTEVKQRSHGEANNTTDGSISSKLEQDPRKAAVAEAIARAKARKAQVQQRPNDTTDGSISDKLEQDPRKAAVAEAIARAKARKAQVQQRPNDTTDGSISDKLEQDPRKAAVAEAIARAKARKMKLQQETNRSQ